MEEDETMDYQSMKRKELQALCKKHGVPANLSNREMADRLSSILGVNKKLTSSKKVIEHNSKAKTKVVKKVKFSPENQTFFYEVSAYKRGGRRRCTPVPKKQIQSTENDVFSPSLAGRKKASTDAKKKSLEVGSADQCDVVELGHRNVIGGIIRRKLRNREVVIGKSDGDLTIPRKNVRQRGSKMVRNEVPEEKVIASKDAKLENISWTVGRITRSQAQFESRDFENEKHEGKCEKAPRPEELLKGVSRNALTRKRKQDVMNGECCKILNENSRNIESINRRTRSPAKTSVDIGAAESKNEEEIVQPEEPSKGLGKYNLRKKSVVPKKGRVGNEKVEVKKETRKRSRNANLEGISEVEAIPDTSKEFEMVKKVFALSGPSRRTRSSSVMFISTDSTNEPLESRQNIGQKEPYVNKNIPRRSRRNVAEKASAESQLASKSEEVNKVANQIVVQSTVIERSNANFVGREEFSGKGAPKSDEIIFKCESSISNAGNGICNQAKTEDNVTINNIEPEEVLYNEKGSQVVCDTIISEDYERNLLVSGSAIPISEKTGGKDAKNKETEVTEGYAQDAMWRENEFSEQNPSNVSKETRGRYMHELSEAEGINVIVMEGTSTDSAHGSVNKGSFPCELDSLKNHGDQEKGSLVLFPIKSGKSLSTSKDKLLVQSDMQEAFKAEVNENVGGLKVEIQEQSLLQLAMEDLRDGIEDDNPDANSNSGKVFCQLSGNCNSVNRTEEQVCDDNYIKEFPLDISNAVRSSELVSEKIYDDTGFEEKNSIVDTVVGDVPFNEDYAASKGIDDTGSNGESVVERGDNAAQEENPDCALKVELRDKSDNEVMAPQENGAAGTSLSELISKESKISNEKEFEKTAECIERVDNLTVKEPKSASKGVGDKGSNEVSAVEQCADVAKEENPDFALKVDLGERSDNEVVASQQNGPAGSSLTDLIFKESEISNEKEVENMFWSAECIERLDNLMVKEFNSENKNSHTAFNDVGTLEQVPSNNLDEEEATEEHHDSVVNIRIAADQEIHAMSVEKRESLEEAENVESSIPVSPEISRKACRYEFVETIDSAPGVSYKVLHANDDDLESRSNEVDFVPPADEEKVFPDIYSKGFLLAARSSELISEKIYDADLAGETNSSVNIIAEDAPFNEDYSASKGIDSKCFRGKSDVDQHADGAKEQNLNCALKFELQDKSDREVVALLENGAAGTSLTELVSKEDQVASEKEVETMLKSAECVERFDNLTVEVLKFGNRNSHSVGNDVTATIMVEEEAMEVHDGSVQSIRIAADEAAHTVAMEKRESLEEAGNVETSVPVIPTTCRKTSRDKFSDISNSAPGVLNEVLHANREDLEKRSNEVVGFVPPADGARFGDLDINNKQNVLELERSTSVISDDLMSTSSRDAYRKENVGIIASDLNSNNYRSDAEKEDNEDTTKKDSDDCLPEVKLCNTKDSYHSVLGSSASSRVGIAEDACEVAVDGKNVSENIEAGTNWLEKTPTFLEKTESERKRDEKKSSEGRFFVDTSFDKPEMGTANDAVDMDSTFKIDNQITEETFLTDQKENEGLNDFIHVLQIEDNSRTADGQDDDQKDAVIDTGFTDGIVCSTSCKFLCSKRRKSTTKVAEKGACSDQICNMVVNENIEELPAVSTLTPRMSTDFSAFSPSIENSKRESKSLELHNDLPQLTSWEINKIFGSGDHVGFEKSAGGISEGNLTTQDYGDAMRVKENWTNELGDQQTTEKHLDEQEHHTHRTVENEPICDNEELNRQNELSAVSRENLYHEIQKDKSNASPEKVMLKEDTTTKDSNIADLDALKAEYVSEDLKEAEHIAVDTGVFSCSKSTVSSMDKEVHTEDTDKMDTQEVENVGTIVPVTPQEPCADCENIGEASNEISGTILQQVFQNGNGWKEKFCDKVAEHDAHSKDKSAYVGRKEMTDKDIGNKCRDTALRFQDSEVIGNNEAAGSSSLEHNVNDSQEVVKGQLIDREAAANEVTFEGDIHYLTLNQPSCDNKGNRHVILTEADRFCRFDDKIVATSGCKKVADNENSIASSTLITEMAIDCPVVSPSIATSKHENKTIDLNVESSIVNSPEMNLFWGSSGQDETENSDAKDVKDNVTIMKQVLAKFTEGQLSQQKAEEVSELNSAIYSDLEEPTSKGSKGPTQQENMFPIIHGTLDSKQLKNEPLKLENMNLAAETPADNAWTLELKLLSPQRRSPESKTRGNQNSLFPKKLNSSTRKHNNKSTLIQRTPKQLGHDMKENFPSTKKQKTGNFTAQKSLSKRRALEDLRK